MSDSHLDLYCLLRDTGGETMKADRGEFVGIFDNEFLELAGDPPIETRTPTIMARDVDVERLELRKAATVTRGTKAYRIDRLEPDGTGLTRIVLRK